MKVFDGTTLLGSAIANGSGAWSYTTAALASGAHSLTATASDAAANTSAASSALSVTIDTVAPTAPVISSNSVSSSNVVTLSGTAEANSTVTVFDGTTQLGTATANASGAWSYSTAALPSGSHSFTETATDAAGNTGVASSALNLTLTTPVTPINLVANGGFETGNFSGWTLGGNYQTINGLWQTTVDNNAQGGSYGAGIGAMGSDATLSQTLQTTPGQQYTLSFWLKNEGAGPNDFTVKWNGTTILALANASAQDYTQYSYTVSATGTTSVLEFDARQDPARWDLDNVSVVATGPQLPSAPTITSFSPDTGVVGDGITDPAVLTLTGTAVANSTVNVYDGATQLGTATASGAGAWSFTTASLPDGVHNFTATDTVSGKTSAASAAMNVTIDTVAPAAPTIASFSTDSGTVGDRITNDATLTLTGTAEANATVKVFDGTTLLGSAVANSSGAWTYTTAALAQGVHALKATATDVAGNTGVASAVMNVTVDAIAPNAPVIVSDVTVNTSEILLTGTAEANNTINVYEDDDTAGHHNSGHNRRVALYDQPTFGRAPRFYCDGIRRCGQHKRCVAAARSGYRRDSTRRADHYVILDRQRRGG